MSAVNNNEELKDIDSNDGLYTVMEDMKDRGVFINEPTIIVLDTNVIDTSATTNTNTSNNASVTNPTTPVVNVNDTDTRRIRAGDENPITRQGSDRRSAFSNRQNRPAQLYPASQPCIYWLNGCCRFGDECHYRHQAPQMTTPSYTAPSQSTSFTSSLPSPPLITVPTKVKIGDNDSKANEIDDKKRRKGGKMKSKKGKEDTIEVETVIPPTVTETFMPPIPPSISPMKKGKKKLSSSGTNPSVESKETNVTEIDELKADLEAKMVIKATEFVSESIKSTDHEMMLLDLFQKSPKHFIQLVKLNDKAKYIPEDMVDRILESRNASTLSLASIQDIINMLKLQIKKKDFITWNQDIIMAYSKQKLDKQANIEEHEGQKIQVKVDSISSDNDRHDDDNQEEHHQQQRKKIEKKSTSADQPTEPSPSPSPSSSSSSYEGDENSQYGQSEYVYDDRNGRNADITNSQIPLNNENSNVNGLATDAQMQGNDDPDNNYYYTYINPANGMQYAYPVSYGYPNPNSPMPTEYMNQYPYGYYPSMDYYSPHGGNYNPMYSSPSTSLPVSPSRSSQTLSSKPETSIQSPSSSPPRQDNVYAPRQDNVYAPRQDNVYASRQDNPYSYGVGMEAGVDSFEQPNYYAPYDYGVQYNQGYYPSVQGIYIYYYHYYYYLNYFTSWTR